jgi:hypothetical protein
MKCALRFSRRPSDFPGSATADIRRSQCSQPDAIRLEIKTGNPMAFFSETL